MQIELGRKVNAIPARIETHRLFLPAILFVLLALPSVYLFSSVPPLWRDSDGFYQVATKFEFLTVLHWPPLYCFCARFPFFLAAVLDESLFHSGFSFNRPRVTDLGVYLLLVFQHLFLIGALLSICLMLAKKWLVRFLIAAIFVSCAPIYVFAHCVGSAEIMAPLLMLGAAGGLKYLCSPSPRWLIFWTYLPLFVIAGGVLLAGATFILKAKSWRDLILATYAIACTGTGIVCAVISFIVVALIPRLTLPTLILLCFAIVVIVLRLDHLRSDQRIEGAVATT